MVICASVVVSFSGCTSNGGESQKKDANENAELVPVWVDSSASPIFTIKPEGVAKPGKNDKRLDPDISSVEMIPASESAIYSKSIDECMERLNIYSNPNGNEYDALSLLGRFKYAQKSEEAMMKQLKAASETWHETIETDVGEKCLVKIETIKTKEISLDEARVTEWKNAVGITPESYANIKCEISTNYSSKTVNISIDLVEVDGKWYLAKTDTLNTIKEVITKTIFK